MICLVEAGSPNLADLLQWSVQSEVKTLNVGLELLLIKISRQFRPTFERLAKVVFNDNLPLKMIYSS
mgnify:CR=1 FL=1